MVHFDGKDYEQIALHGGGNPMFGHYVGLFETLKCLEDLKSFDIPLITSSAGSMAILYFIVRSKEKEADISYLFRRILEECENVLENIDQKTVISFEFLDNLVRTDFASVYDMTFRDLNELNSNFKWTICCSKYDNFEFSLQTYGTHTPDVIIWKACIASMALPIIFPAVEINNCLNCDGDLCNWVKEMNIVDDRSILHICPAKRINGGGDFVNTEIPLLDESIKFTIFCFLRMISGGQEPAHGVNRAEFPSSVHKHFLSEEYIESGKLMAKKFVLK